ncbi:MAG: hypothetical protein ACQETL_14745 [Bacteroidota bacterium]
MDKEKSYKVITTKSATLKYQLRVLPYLFENFNFNRATEIEEKILKFATTLSSKPARGRREIHLSSFKEDFRFILFQETKNFELKIIYFIDETELIVYITDFFPTKLNPQKIIG